MKIRKAERDRLLKHLKRGDRRRVAEQLDVHVNSVENVLLKEYENPKIYKALVELAEKNYREEKSIIERVKKLPA